MSRRTARLALTVAAAVAVVAAGVWVYATFDPAASVWFPKCMFKAATGYDCPGCGSQRAIHALLGGDIAGAWRANAAFILSLPLLALLATMPQWRRRFPRPARFLGSRPFILALFLAFLTWWIGRNIL